MPSVSALSDAASNWMKIRENARAELRIGNEAKGRRDKENIVTDFMCAEEQLQVSQRKVADHLESI